ncbi:MAG: DUF5615 family PIN-like protein [Saprospiraceae bacterium]|jgi:predicted nuclease of predicted toxin-antitoxin system|nr:DUF5615 family PIN-like protein [Saprospiraceae bacterium]
MAKYLIDVNLPYYFALWNTSEYIHQMDINPLAKDKLIWEYAKENGLTIISKDSDFSNRILFKDPPPKVIHIKIGNVSMKEFHRLINSCWEDVIQMSESHKLVNVYKDTIEGVK